MLIFQVFIIKSYNWESNPLQVSHIDLILTSGLDFGAFLEEHIWMLILWMYLNMNICEALTLMIDIVPISEIKILVSECAMLRLARF